LYERRRRREAEIEAHQRLTELARINRRATVGELSASIAHELNQPLSAILHNVEAAQLMFQSGSPDLAEIRAILADIQSDDERASEVIRRLRRLLAKAPTRPQEFDLNEAVREVFEFLANQAAAGNVALTTLPCPQAPRINGDRVQLQQVIMNLAMNALEAIGSANSPERRISCRTVMSDEATVEVSIEDTGPGIPIDKQRQIFEPFFTTKETGMGMGLSIARTIVESHGGRIWAEDRSGGGAVFRFSLPVVKRKSASPRHDGGSRDGIDER
jgi:signal transduction histidine kinase